MATARQPNPFYSPTTLVSSVKTLLETVPLCFWSKPGLSPISFRSNVFRYIITVVPFLAGVVVLVSFGEGAVFREFNSVVSVHFVGG